MGWTLSRGDQFRGTGREAEERRLVGTQRYYAAAPSQARPGSWRDHAVTAVVQCPANRFEVPPGTCATVPALDAVFPATGVDESVRLSKMSASLATLTAGSAADSVAMYAAHARLRPGACPSTTPRPAVRRGAPNRFDQVVVVGRRVLDGVVERRAGRVVRVVDPEDVPDDQADAEGVGDVGRLPVLADLVAVARPRSLRPPEGTRCWRIHFRHRPSREFAPPCRLDVRAECRRCSPRSGPGSTCLVRLGSNEITPAT